VLRDYSEALGIAYQIRDDLEDLADPDPVDSLGIAGPSLLLALACDKTKASGRDQVMTLWRDCRTSAAAMAAFRTLLGELGVEERANALLEAYKEQAIRTLPALQNASLKGLLRRVVGKVFRVEIKGWCSEFETRDAAGRQVGAQRAG
jgi:geranylgeranyl diphosphate synthase type II